MHILALFDTTPDTAKKYVVIDQNWQCRIATKLVPKGKR